MMFTETLVGRAGRELFEMQVADPVPGSASIDRLDEVVVSSLVDADERYSCVGHGTITSSTTTPFVAPYSMQHGADAEVHETIRGSPVEPQGPERRQNHRFVEYRCRAKRTRHHIDHVRHRR
ncbi:MAG: hypothetical protein ACK5OX_14910 [Desertimonas sp.]